MESFQLEEAIRSRLNETVSDGSPFVSVREAGPATYKAWMTTDEPHFTSRDELFSTYDNSIVLNSDYALELRHIGFDTEKVRYVTVRVVERE